MKRAVIIQGAPGVGKTTLARKLERDLGLKLIAKDDIKEYLYDRLGPPADRAESTVYGRAAIRSVYATVDEFLKANQKVILEGAFLPEYAQQDLSLVVKFDELLQLYVYCEPAVHEVRFSRRAADGTRHSGHIDSSINAAEQQDRYGAIPDIDTVMVDTTHFEEDDYQTMLEKVQNTLREK